MVQRSIFQGPPRRSRPLASRFLAWLLDHLPWPVHPPAEAEWTAGEPPAVPTQAKPRPRHGPRRGPRSNPPRRPRSRCR